LKNILVIFLIMAFLTSFPGLPVQAQYEEGVETVNAQYYGGVETTNFGVYDPEARVWVQVPVSRLPWWWTPPPDWVLWSTLGIATAAVVMSAVFIGGGLSFGSVFFNDYRYRGRLGHFHHFRDSVVGPRFRTHYGSARRDAERRHPGGLKHPPGNRGHAGPGIRGSHGPGPGVRGPSPQHHAPAAPNAVRGPRSTGTPQGSGIHQSGPGNVRSPRGPSGSPSPHPGMSGPRSPRQIQGPQVGHPNRQPNMGQSRMPQSHRGPAMAPRNAPRAPAPVRQQAPRGGGGKPQPQKKPH
jgi:hypothetical protein